MGCKCPVAVILCNRVHVRRVARLDRVALHALLWSNAPAIVHAVSFNVSLVQRGGRDSAYIRQTLFLTSTMVDEEKWVYAELETRTEHLSSSDGLIEIGGA